MSIRRNRSNKKTPRGAESSKAKRIAALDITQDVLSNDNDDYSRNYIWVEGEVIFGCSIKIHMFGIETKKNIDNFIKY